MKKFLLVSLFVSSFIFGMDEDIRFLSDEILAAESSAQKVSEESLRISKIFKEESFRKLGVRSSNLVSAHETTSAALEDLVCVLRHEHQMVTEAIIENKKVLKELLAINNDASPRRGCRLEIPQFLPAIFVVCLTMGSYMYCISRLINSFV